MAVLRLTVNREASTARAAVSASSKAVAQLLDTFADMGIAERDLQTSGFSIHPNYTHLQRTPSGSSEARRLTGYTVRNSLTLRVRDIDRVGEFLDQAVHMGVNEGGNITFTNPLECPRWH